MKVLNSEIARMIEARGYDLQRALDAVDAARTEEQEETEELTVEEVNKLVEDTIGGFEEEDEFKPGGIMYQ